VWEISGYLVMPTAILLTCLFFPYCFAKGNVFLIKNMHNVFIFLLELLLIISQLFSSVQAICFSAFFDEFG
jgi:hypothetical protein